MHNPEWSSEKAWTVCSSNFGAECCIACPIRAYCKRLPPPTSACGKPGQRANEVKWLDICSDTLHDPFSMVYHDFLWEFQGGWACTIYRWSDVYTAYASNNCNIITHKGRTEQTMIVWNYRSEISASPWVLGGSTNLLSVEKVMLSFKCMCTGVRASNRHGKIVGVMTILDEIRNERLTGKPWLRQSLGIKEDSMSLLPTSSKAQFSTIKLQYPWFEPFSPWPRQQPKHRLLRRQQTLSIFLTKWK